MGRHSVTVTSPGGDKVQVCVGAGDIAVSAGPSRSFYETAYLTIKQAERLLDGLAAVIETAKAQRARTAK